MHWIIDWLLKIESFINKIIDFILRKEKNGGVTQTINQTINNQKKKNLINIQFGGVRNYYKIVEQKVPLQESMSSSAHNTSDIEDEETEKIVNQYLETQIEHKHHE